MKKIVFLLILITFFIATSFKNVEAAPFSPSDQKAIQDFFKQFTNTRDPSTAPSPKASPTAPLNDSPTPSQNPTVTPSPDTTTTLSPSQNATPTPTKTITPEPTETTNSTPPPTSTPEKRDDPAVIAQTSPIPSITPSPQPTPVIEPVKKIVETLYNPRKTIPTGISEFLIPKNLYTNDSTRISYSILVFIMSLAFFGSGFYLVDRKVNLRFPKIDNRTTFSEFLKTSRNKI